MAKSLICNFGTFGMNDNATYYVPITGSIRLDASVHPTEAYVEIPIRTAGTFRRLRFRIPSNTASVTSVVTLRKNTAATALTKNVTSDATGWFEVVADVAVSVGDRFAIEVVVPAETGTNTLTLNATMLEFEPDDASITMQLFACTGDNPSLSTDSTTRYCSHGLMVYSSSIEEGVAKFRFRSACTVQNLYVNVISNARTTDTTFLVRKNGASGSGLVTYTSGQTGAHQDTSNTDSFSAGDDYNVMVTTLTGGGAIVVSVVAVEVITTNRTFHLVVGTAAGDAFTGVNPVYEGLGGDLSFNASTEVDVAILPSFAFTASDLNVMVKGNTNATSSPEIRLRINSADTSLVVAPGTLGTGLKTETSPTTQAVAAEDPLTFEVDNIDAVGTLTLTWIGMLATVPASGSSVPVIEHTRRQLLRN